jgi:hypothetical protein
MRTRSLLSAFAVLAMGSGLLAQESPLSFGVKTGGGLVVSNAGDQASRVAVGLAFFGEYKLAATSSVFGELKYRNFRAMYHEVTRLGTGYSTTSTPAVPVTGNITQATSVDIRRDPVEGLGLGFGYRSRIIEDLSWQAGISLDWLKSTQEVTGQLTVGATREGLSYTPTTSKIKPGAFAGVQWTVSKNMYLETNLTYVAFQQVNYVPKAYSNVAAHTETKSVGKVLLEVNCGFRF